MSDVFVVSGADWGGARRQPSPAPRSCRLSAVCRGARENGVVWEILVPNLPPGALRAGHTQLRPAVIAARCKIGNFRAALRPYLGKNETELYLTCFPVVL